MSRITANAATCAAQQMAAVIFNDRINDAEKKLKEFVDKLYEENVPKVIRVIASDYPQIVCLGWTIIFKRESSNKEVVVCTTLPHVGLRSLSIRDEQFDYLSVLKSNCDSLKNEKVAYMHSVAQCLIGLKSTTAVKEQFPEALEYLGVKPSDKSEGPYSELRKKLQQAKTEK